MHRFLLYDLRRFQAIQNDVTRRLNAHVLLPDDDRVLERLEFRAGCLEYNRIMTNFYLYSMVIDPLTFLQIYETGMFYVGLCHALDISVV